MTMFVTPVVLGVVASGLMLLVYFVVLGSISGVSYAQQQFVIFWPFIVSLSVGFGIQVGLYTHLRGILKNMHAERNVLGVTGTTSTAAMISCCAHYLVNVLPVLGATGFVTFFTQYQNDLFWVGIVSNVAGIAYLVQKMRNVTKV